MASPIDAGRTTTSVSTSGTGWSLNLPASISSGNLLLAYLRANSESPSGVNSSFAGAAWQLLLEYKSDAAPNTDLVYYKIATGSETTPITFSWLDASSASVSVKGGTIVWRITGHDSGISPEIASTFGTGANPNPPNIVPIGGSQDYLFIALAGLDGETQTFTVPTNYSNLQQANSGTGGAATTNIRSAGATRQLTATSEDPGVFTAAAPSNGWSAHTIAIYPTGAILPSNPEAPYVGGGYYW